MNIDKIYKILIDGAKEREKERKKWNEALLFAALRFEEVATEALNENKNEED